MFGGFAGWLAYEFILVYRCLFLWILWYLHFGEFQPINFAANEAQKKMTKEMFCCWPNGAQRSTGMTTMERNQHKLN